VEPQESKLNTEAPPTEGEASQAARTAPPAQQSGWAGVWETVRSLTYVLAAVYCIRTFIAEATVIPTGSMEKTILVGDHVFLSKLPYGPRLPFTSLRFPPFKPIHRQDIVAFRYPRNPSVMFVKRVIGIGGDVIRIVNKRVFVNGRPVKEAYAQIQNSALLPLRDNFPPTPDEVETLPAAWGLDPGWAAELPSYIHDDGLHVPKGYLFVMGDNRENSLDSRFWGFVPVDNVVGEPLFVYWSYEAPSRDWTNEDRGARVRFDLSIVWNFIYKTRWSRMGKFF